MELQSYTVQILLSCIWILHMDLFELYLDSVSPFSSFGCKFILKLRIQRLRLHNTQKNAMRSQLPSASYMSLLELCQIDRKVQVYINSAQLTKVHLKEVTHRYCACITSIFDKESQGLLDKVCAVNCDENSPHMFHG